MRGIVIALVLVLAASAARHACARGGPEPKGGAKAAGPANLMGGPIRDLPTTVSVPVSEDRSLVLSLPAGFWTQCPRYLPRPTSLAGQGLVLQYLNARGGSVSMLYVGTVPLGDVFEGDAPSSRAERAAADFAADLAQKYARVHWTLPGGAVELLPGTLKIGRKKTATWRTKRYTTRPNDAAGPDSVFSGECLLLQPEGTNVLAYIALDAKAGGTTLDVAIQRLDVRPTRGLHPKGRRVQLNDMMESAPGRYPVRLMAFDLPAGFAPTRALADVRGEWVYVEERLTGAGGPPDAVLRMDGRLAAPSETAATAAADQLALWPAEGRTPLQEVELAVRGHKAQLFHRSAADEGEGAQALTAVLILDDQVLTLTWICRVGGDQVARDHDLLVALLRSVEMAVRW